MSDKDFLIGTPPRQGKTIKAACDKMTEIIESCWDENNPDDGLSFDERLHKKMEELPEEDKDLLDKVLRFE